MERVGGPGWTPTLGAWVHPDGVAFRVWAPRCRALELVVERAGEPSVYPLVRSSDGTFSTVRADVGVGDCYRYRLDGGPLLPDPASRYQPDGVHGPSQVVAPGTFRWTTDDWTGVELDRTVFYEVHVGTFSAAGTFDGVTARLPELAALGVTVVELMPLGDFPGNRNWGYDGVALFAPARCYGTPDDLRRLVDSAHGLGLGVCLDVVYNHLGPDGAYLSAFSPDYFTDRHQTPWGAGLNFDGEGSAHVREFFIENAHHWIHEYRFDALRLDATHAIADDSPVHFVTELTARVRDSVSGRGTVIVAEDHRNLDVMLKPRSDGGWGLDGVWADDFHHQMRRQLAGDSEGYYGDFTGRTEDIAATIRGGWFYTGQVSAHLGGPRGTDAVGIARSRFVICLQNHDQIGNRALGERLHHQIDPAAYRAASVLLLTAPETPLLFMGQEWAASSPFLYFTDHHDALGALVTAGRREEFRHFSAFSDPAVREQIPDPQSASTFTASDLRWDERRTGVHAATLRLYEALLALRGTEPALRGGAPCEVVAVDAATIAMRRGAPGASLLVVVRLDGAGTVDLARRMPALFDRDVPSAWWRPVLTSEDAAFSLDPMLPTVEDGPAGPVVRFARPSALVLRPSAWR